MKKILIILIILGFHLDLYPQQLLGSYKYGSFSRLIFLPNNIVSFDFYRGVGQGKYEIKKGKLYIYPYECYELHNHKYYLLRKNSDTLLTIINLENPDFNPTINATIYLLDSNKNVLYKTTSDSNGQVFLKYNDKAELIKVTNDFYLPYSFPYKPTIGKNIRIYMEEGNLREDKIFYERIKIINENEFQLGKKQRKWIITSTNHKIVISGNTKTGKETIRHAFAWPWQLRIMRNNKQVGKRIFVK